MKDWPERVTTAASVVLFAAMIAAGVVGLVDLLGGDYTHVLADTFLVLLILTLLCMLLGPTPPKLPTG